MSPMSEMFVERTPEAAALQLATVLVTATEWNLATLERLQMRKGSSQHDLRRQKHICDAMVKHCRELRVNARFGLDGARCPRLEELLAATSAEGASATSSKPAPDGATIKPA